MSLAVAQAVAELADNLYGYLPGSSPGPAYTFASAASECGVAEFWEPGTKLPAITRLLTLTLEHKRGSFCKLIEVVVAHGLEYRIRKKDPLCVEDIEKLNSLVQRVGFKIFALWDPAFLAGLPRKKGTRPTETGPTVDDANPSKAIDSKALAKLREEFLELNERTDRPEAGYALEGLLKRLFAAFELEPRDAFRVTGEQIDGSFVLDHEVYLLEAKWQKQSTNQQDLLAFRGKIEGKSSLTRGLFVSINGYSVDGVEALTKGKQPNFVMMDGAHLFRVLDGAIRFDEMLRLLIRRLAETGDPYVPASRL